MAHMPCTCIFRYKIFKIISYTRVNSQNDHIFFKKKKKEKRKKKKGSGRGNPHGPFGGDSPHLATSQIGAVEPHSSLMGVDRPPPWPNGGGRTTLMGCRGGSPPHFDQMVVDRASHWSNGGGHPFFFLK